jgi:HK97 family phage portal protein
VAFLDMFRRNQRLRLPAYAPNGAPIEYDMSAVKTLLGMSLEDLWRSQPHLRTVVSFLARNIAQLGLHEFQRVTDTDRVRVRDSVTARTLAAPNESQTGYDLIEGLVADLALYDVAYWWVAVDLDRPSGWRIDALSPSWIVNSGGGSLWAPAWYDVGLDKKDATRIKAEDLVIFRGWNPGQPSEGASPVEALRQVLAEQIHAYVYRQQVWERGGRVDIISRPAGVTWSDPARERFSKEWAAQWTGDDGPKAGGTPILEDGMTLQKIRFSAHEEEWVEAAKLSLSTVAQVYHVNPTMVGLLDNANFSNVREFRRMLYGDTLGPTIAKIEARINGFLLPKLGESEDHYVEFNIDEKLQGSFEEQTQALQASVGRPWMTADEARSLRNMPAIGGDASQLVTPLNVLVGGQASPRDSGKSGRKHASSHTKASPPATYNEKVEEILSAFFRRQGAAVLSALGSKAADAWWDAERWDGELADDLQRVAHLIADPVGLATAESFGGEYDVERTEPFLRAVAESRAGAINSTTKGQLDEAIADPDKSPADVFENAQASRKSIAATTLVTTFAAFATTEAAKQIGGDKATKTWNTSSKKPRASHARMNGETVGIEEPFSNGMNWPGDPVGGADEVAGCTCNVTVDFA